MCRLARDFAIGAGALRQLIDDLDEQPDNWKAGLRRSTQAEFSQFALPTLLRFKANEPGAVLRLLLQGELEDDADPQGTNEQTEALLKRVEQLFEGHPRPFDLADTVRRASDRFAGTIRKIDRPWPESLVCCDESFQELSAWPTALDVADRNANLNREVSDAELTAAREKLRKVDNPIGKRIVDLLFDHVDMCSAASASKRRGKGRG